MRTILTSACAIILGLGFILAGDAGWAKAENKKTPEKQEQAADTPEALYRKAWASGQSAAAYVGPWLMTCGPEDAAKTKLNAEQTKLLNTTLADHKKLFEMREAPVGMRADAAAGLAYFYDLIGKPEEARKVYEAMSALGDAPIVTYYRVNAATNVAVAYARAGNYREERKIYDAMPGLADEAFVRATRDDTVREPQFGLHINEAAVRGMWFNTAESMINAYIKAENFEEARKIYDTMPASDDSEIARAHAAMRMIFAYGKAGKLSEARKMYSAMSQLGDSLNVKEYREKAASFIKSMSELGDSPTPEQLRDRADEAIKGLREVCL